MKGARFFFLLSLLILLALAACRPQPGPIVDNIDVQPGTTIAITEKATLSVNATGERLVFAWTAERGTLSQPADRAAVTYTAPSTPGADSVVVTVSSGNLETSRTISFNVVAPTPTATAIPAPTDTATPSATPLPPTLTPAPSDTPSPTPCPLGLACEVFPQAAEGKVFQWTVESTTLQWDIRESCAHAGPYGLWLQNTTAGSGHAGWGVQWVDSPMGNFNASGFSALSFQVRAMSGSGHFAVGLKDTADVEEKVPSGEVAAVSSERWSAVNIPLSRFEPVNLQSLENFSITFVPEDGNGAICVDEIAFTP